MSHFNGKVAIVTGGASGIGRALSELLAERGATVVIADINGQEAGHVVSGIARDGGGAEAVVADVSRASDVERLVREAASKHGRLDYMFNNAAIGIVGEVRDASLEHWRRIIDVNLLGVVHGSAAAYSLMADQGSGHIVNIASMTGLIGSPTFALYSTTKFAVVGFSTALRREAASLGVNVSVVCPGLVKTRFGEPATYLNVRKEDHLARLPSKMLMDPGKAARAILRGIKRNRAIIVFPFYARLFWWCHRLSPSLLTPLLDRSVHEFREMRIEPEARRAGEGETPASG